MDTDEGVCTRLVDTDEGVWPLFVVEVEAVAGVEPLVVGGRRSAAVVGVPREVTGCRVDEASPRDVTRSRSGTDVPGLPTRPKMQKVNV